MLTKENYAEYVKILKEELVPTYTIDKRDSIKEALSIQGAKENVS